MRELYATGAPIAALDFSLEAENADGSRGPQQTAVNSRRRTSTSPRVTLGAITISAHVVVPLVTL